MYVSFSQKRVVTALRLIAQMDDEFLKTYESPPASKAGPKSRNVDLVSRTMN